MTLVYILIGAIICWIIIFIIMIMNWRSMGKTDGKQFLHSKSEPKEPKIYERVHNHKRGHKDED